MFQILFSTQIQFNFGCCVRKIPETNELWLCPEKLYLSLQLTYTAYFIAPVKIAGIINRTFEFQSNFHNITFATEVLQISQFRSRVKLITICYLALFQQSETSQTSQGWDNISQKYRKSMILSGVRPKYSTVCLRIPVPSHYIQMTWLRRFFLFSKAFRSWCYSTYISEEIENMNWWRTDYFSQERRQSGNSCWLKKHKCQSVFLMAYYYVY